MPQTTRQQFRAMLNPGSAVILPGVANAFAALVVSDCGFAAAILTVSDVNILYLGMPVHVPATPELIAAIGRMPYPKLMNIVIGGKTPERTNEELQRLGFAGVLYANTALQAAVLGMQRALGHLKQNGQIGNAADLLASFTERQRLVDIASFQAMERKYK